MPRTVRELSVNFTLSGEYIYLPKRMLHSPEIRRVVAEMAGLTLALVCVAAAGLLVVIE